MSKEKTTRTYDLLAPPDRRLDIRKVAGRGFDYLFRRLSSPLGGEGAPSLAGCRDLSADELEAVMARLPAFAGDTPINCHISKIRPYGVRREGRIIDDAAGDG
jgi:hypothetical protein